MSTVLQINVTANEGSTGRIAEGIGTVALKDGYNSFIAYGRSEKPGLSNHFKIGSIINIYFHVLQTRLFDNHGLGLASRRATKQLISTIRKIQPDIIHLHNIHGYYLNYKILFQFLSQLNIPVVWTLHDCWAYTGHCAYYSLSKCNRWKSECCNCPCLMDYPRSILFDNSKSNFRNKKKIFTSLKNLTLVPVSKWLENEVKQSFLGIYPIHTIHNGIDTHVFSQRNDNTIRAKYNIKNKYVLLGVASPWSTRKGLKDFLSLRKMLSEKYVIVLVGVSKKQMQDFPEGIIGIERTSSSAELASFYSMADVFINTTYEDNYPTVNLEAIACGTPVITYCTGGSPESVTSETGRVVETGNLYALIDAIHSIEKISKNEIATSCRRYAEQHFEQIDCFQEYVKLYNKILNK